MLSLESLDTIRLCHADALLLMRLIDLSRVDTLLTLHTE